MSKLLNKYSKQIKRQKSLEELGQELMALYNYIHRSTTATKEERERQIPKAIRLMDEIRARHEDFIHVKMIIEPASASTDGSFREVQTTGVAPTR